MIIHVTRVESLGLEVVTTGTGTGTGTTTWRYRYVPLTTGSCIAPQQSLQRINQGPSALNKSMHGL